METERSTKTCCWGSGPGPSSPPSWSLSWHGD